MSVQGDRDFLHHRSLTAGFDVVIPNMIWKVSDLCDSDLTAVYPALCDWSNVDMEEINKTKAIVTRVVFGRPTQGHTGSNFGTDFIKLSFGRECIYIRPHDSTHNAVSICYGIMPSGLEVHCAAGSVDWDMFCMIMSCRADLVTSSPGETLKHWDVRDQFETSEMNVLTRETREARQMRHETWR